MNWLRIHWHLLAAILIAAAGVSVAVVPGCTPAQRQLASPAVRAGGLVCLTVPDEDREVCAQAIAAARAALEALEQMDQQSQTEPSSGSPADAAPSSSGPS